MLNLNCYICINYYFAVLYNNEAIKYLKKKKVSDVTIFQVMSILILPGNNWYPVINGSKAV